MSFTALPSDHIVVIRDRCKQCVATGLTLSPDETEQLVRRLNTVVELAREFEADHRISALALIAAETWIRNRRDADQPSVGPSAVVVPFRRPAEILIEGDRA